LQQNPQFLLRRARRPATGSQHLCPASRVNHHEPRRGDKSWSDSRRGNRGTSIRKEKSLRCSDHALRPASTSSRLSGNTICRSNFQRRFSRKHPRFRKPSL
jgi:hypothetical protein